ncbi:hypothetical protein VMCG_01370 [Cytospora schulzeri]|uniref:Uncharacterized protein n=1 Tax=Cytospora schulzeri TaxID=448051 RepID=A0A423X4S4_9PEZI|nr:hypothetical protein VMCG_01370 [Valsa malicola]
MVPTFSKPEDTQDERDGWTLVDMEHTSGNRSPQYNDCSNSSSQQGAHTAGHELSDLTTKGDHRRPDEAKSIYVHLVKVHHSEYVESTATWRTSSTPESGDVNSFSSIPHLEPCPLTSTILEVHNIPGLRKDITAWVRGEPDYCRPIEDDASILSLKEHTTLPRSEVPEEPWPDEQVLLGTGRIFEGHVPRSQSLEID